VNHLWGGRSPQSILKGGGVLAPKIVRRRRRIGVFRGTHRDKILAWTEPIARGKVHDVVAVSIAARGPLRLRFHDFCRPSLAPIG
jgi:hypothetical protein